MWPLYFKQINERGIVRNWSSKVSELCRHVLSAFLVRDKSPQLDISTAYLDGLRGLAAFCVYIEHFSIILFPYVRYGYDGLNSQASLLQLPIARILFAGTSMVNIFFILSGYVLSLKPYTHAKSQSYDRVLSSISSTLFRRAHRLYYPGLVSTFLVMLAVSLHIFDISAEFPIKPLRPLQRSTWWGQYVDWSDFVWKYLANIWAWGGGSRNVKSNYGAHLWTLPALFQCSVIALMSLLAFCHFRFVANMLLTTTLGCFCMLWDMDRIALALYGTALARVHVEYRDRKGTTLQTFLFYTLLVVGVYIASLPEFRDTTTPIFGYPSWMFDLRFGLCYTLGAVLIVGSVTYLRQIQKLLSMPIPRYLGEISYSLYIVHEPLLQMFGWSLTNRIRQATETWHWLVHICAIGLCWISVTAVIILTAHCFWKIVELPSVTYARWIEDSFLEQQHITTGLRFTLNTPSTMHAESQDYIVAVDVDQYAILNGTRKLGYRQSIRLLIATAPFLVALPGIMINQLRPQPD